MKVERNLVHAMCSAKISDREALQIAQFKNRGYAMRFYQIGLLITLSVTVFLAHVDARDVFMVLAFLLILGSIFNDAMDYLTGSCLLWRDYTKVDLSKKSSFVTKLSAVSPSIKVGLAAAFFTPNAALISKMILLVIFVIGSVASYVIFTISFNHYLRNN